jgi:hypothetical protein
MAQETSSRDDPPPTFEGELSVPPRGALLIGMLAITGLLLVLEVGKLIGRYVLGFRRPTEVRLTPSGIELRGRTVMVGKVLREFVTVLPREGMVRVTREVRYPSVAVYAGLIALVLGSYLGVGLFVDGVRASSPSMLGTGLIIALLGLGLDFVLSSLAPGLQGKSRVVIVPRRGPILCVTSVDPSRADVLLGQLSKAARTTSERPRPAVEAAGADHLADESERNGAGDAR